MCRILSAKLRAGSGITFLKKFNIDLSRADLCGRHCKPITWKHKRYNVNEKYLKASYDILQRHLFGLSAL